MSAIITLFLGVAIGFVCGLRVGWRAMEVYAVTELEKIYGKMPPKEPGQ